MVKHDEHIEYYDEGTLARISVRLIPVVIFLGAFGVYFQSMAPSVYWGNSALLAAGSNALGIAPPPSFPLYTLIGRVFALMPGLEPAFAANLMSALFAALSVMVFFLLTRCLMNVPALRADDYQKIMNGKKLLFRRPDLKVAGKMLDLERATQPPAVILFVCFALTALFAMTLPVWLAAVRAEVYSLQLFMTLLAVYFVGRGQAHPSARWYYLGFWVYVLSFANHPFMALAMAPAFVFLLITRIPEIKNKVALFSTIGFFVILSLSVYTYLPLRAAFDPIINWGGPGSWSAFGASIINSIGMHDTSSAATSTSFLTSLNNLRIFIIEQVGWPIVIMLVFGFWGMFKISRRLTWFFAFAILSNLLLLLRTAGFSSRSYEIINFLAPVIAFILILSIAGSLLLLRRIIVGKNASIYMAAFLTIFVGYAADRNLSQADISQVTAPEQISEAILNDLPENSILILANDDLLMPLWYYTHSGVNRNKTRIVSESMLTNNDSRRQIEELYPDLMFPDTEIIESGQNSYNALSEFCRLNKSDNRIFVQYGVSGLNPEYLEPRGILFEQIEHKYTGSIDHTVSGDHIAMAIQLLEGNPDDINTIEFTGQWLFSAASYFSDMKRQAIARDLMRTAIEVDAENIDMRLQLADNLSRAGLDKEALKYIAQALDLDPYHTEVLGLGHQIAQKANARANVTDK